MIPNGAFIYVPEPRAGKAIALSNVTRLYN